MKYLKFIIFATSLYFLFLVIQNNINELAKIEILDYRRWIYAISLTSIIYFISMLCMSLNWKLILEGLTEKRVSYRFFWIYLKTVIYKYIPGNIFHYVLRQVEAKKEGIPHKKLIQSNVYEAVLIILASFIISMVAFFITGNQYIEMFVNEYTLILILLFFIGISYLIVKYFNKVYLSVVGIYIIFFTIVGLVLYILAHELLNINLLFFHCVMLFSISWLGGFILPGAPGGLGVRESLFILLSEGLLSQHEAFVLALVLRLVTLIGEVICFLLAMYYMKRDIYREKNV